MLSYENQLDSIFPTFISGMVSETLGPSVHVADFPVPLGAVAEIECRNGNRILAEVVGFREQTAILFPYGRTSGIRRGDRVYLRHTSRWLCAGMELLGQVLDAHGHPQRYGSSLCVEALPDRIPFLSPAPRACDRPSVEKPLSTGVRSVDSLLTLGCGQRVGIFAGSGVGKSVLMGMMARYTSADIIVIGLVGERGREVNDFIQHNLGAAGLKRSVLVVATSDEPAVTRLQAAYAATALAEYFRDKGKNVLLLMDSLTRFAMAQREIGLASGEPPTTRGYPSSVFSLLPTLVERAGRTQQGSITAIYTVLVEGDDANEPVADTVRGLLDGHIWLSRKLATAGHYPAVDVLSSISRLMPNLCDKVHLNAALEMRRLLAVWRENEDLVSLGAYHSGTNPDLDRALELQEKIRAFLVQDVDEPCDLHSARTALLELLGNKSEK